MFSPLPTRQRSLNATALSVGAHLLIAAGLMASLRSRPVHIFTLPGTDHGSRVELSYMPGSAPAPPAPSKVKAKVRASQAREVTTPAKLQAPAQEYSAVQLPPMPHLTVTESKPTPTPSPSPDPANGSDSWGSGSMQIAFTTFSPSPKPDLSSLPHGVQGDVVVDVTIDSSGKVADLALQHTLGFGIESSVLGTLKTWTFRPATKDGTPIASVQELHFHYGPV